jgi:hypothetical protein
MVDFNTPQLKAVKKLVDAYVSLDLNNAEPLTTKDFHYEPLPESTGYSKQSKEVHLQVWRELLSSVNKLEVRVRHRRTAFKLAD